jgi:hypothetical protein
MVHLRVIGRGRLALVRRRERKTERRLHEAIGRDAVRDRRRPRVVTVEQLAANRELPMLEDPRRTGGHD